MASASGYRGQEKEFHHEEHKAHEEGQETLLLSTLCYSSSLRVRAFLRGVIFLNSIAELKVRGFSRICKKFLSDPL
jgi:hypothetical protein